MLDTPSTLRILQYNINKSKVKVMAPLLQERAIEGYDILIIQEPWRNPFDQRVYNPRGSGFAIADNGGRIAIYVNRRIDPNTWTVEWQSPDIGTIILSRPGEEISIINIHGVYIPPPASHSEVSNNEGIIQVRQALSMRGDHVMVGDFNLHHPYWGGPTYPHQHAQATDLLQETSTAGLTLATPEGTITRDTHAQQ